MVKYRRFLRPWSATGGSVALIAGVAFSVAAPAGTALAGTSTVHGCPPTYMCLYVDTSYSGERGDFAGDNPNLADDASSTCGTWSDCAESAYNNGTSGDAVILYSGTNYTGNSYCIADNTGATKLPIDLFNEAKSNKWVSAC